MIGTVDQARAYDVVHPGAVYLHQGRAWQVVRAGPGRPHRRGRAGGRGHLHPDPVADLHPVAGHGPHQGGGRIPADAGQRGGDHPGGRLPDPQHAQPRGPGPDAARPAAHAPDHAGRLVRVPAGPGGTGLGRHHAALPGALHAAEHAAIGILPLFTICDRWDVGGVSTVELAETGAATVVIHDGHPGGAGIAELAYDAADRHLAATLDVLSSLPLHRRLPQLRAVPQVRQRQRAARQGRRGPAGVRHPGRGRTRRALPGLLSGAGPADGAWLCRGSSSLLHPDGEPFPQQDPRNGASHQRDL